MESVNCGNGTTCEPFLVTSDTCVEYVDDGESICLFPCSLNGCKKVVIFDEDFCKVFLCTAHNQNSVSYLGWILSPLICIVLVAMFLFYKRYKKGLKPLNKVNWQLSSSFVSYFCSSNYSYSSTFRIQIVRIEETPWWIRRNSDFAANSSKLWIRSLKF